MFKLLKVKEEAVFFILPLKKKHKTKHYLKFLFICLGATASDVQGTIWDATNWIQVSTSPSVLSFQSPSPYSKRHTTFSIDLSLHIPTSINLCLASLWIHSNLDLLHGSIIQRCQSSCETALELCLKIYQLLQFLNKLTILSINLAFN